MDPQQRAYSVVFALDRLYYPLDVFILHVLHVFSLRVFCSGNILYLILTPIWYRQNKFKKEFEDQHVPIQDIDAKDEKKNANKQSKKIFWNTRCPCLDLSSDGATIAIKMYQKKTND